MYKHIKKGTGTTTIVDSDGTNYVFSPGKVYYLKRKINNYRGIVCLGRDKPIEQEQRVPIKDKKSKED